jgi:hypothetical protein
MASHQVKANMSMINATSAAQHVNQPKGIQTMSVYFIFKKEGIKKKLTMYRQSLPLARRHNQNTLQPE